MREQKKNALPHVYCSDIKIIIGRAGGKNNDS